MTMTYIIILLDFIFISANTFYNKKRRYIFMISKLKSSLNNINYKLYFALIILGLSPAIYTTVRVFLSVNYQETGLIRLPASCLGLTCFMKF